MEPIQNKQVIKLEEVKKQSSPAVESIWYFKLANLITVSRILLIPAVILLLVYSHKYPVYEHYALYLLIYMQASDIFDGIIARYGKKKYNKKNHLGEALDPMADKLYINCTFITLSITHGFPFWITLIIFFRDAVLITGWLFGVTFANIKDINPNILGKFADGCQAFLIFFFLLKLPESIIKFSWRLTIFATILSGMVYVTQGYRKISSSFGK